MALYEYYTTVYHRYVYLSPAIQISQNKTDLRELNTKNDTFLFQKQKRIHPPTAATIRFYFQFVQNFHFAQVEINPGDPTPFFPFRKSHNNEGRESFLLFSCKVVAEGDTSLSKNIPLLLPSLCSPHFSLSSFFLSGDDDCLPTIQLPEAIILNRVIKEPFTLCDEILTYSGIFKG